MTFNLIGFIEMRKLNVIIKINMSFYHYLDNPQSTHASTNLTHLLPRHRGIVDNGCILTQVYMEDMPALLCACLTRPAESPPCNVDIDPPTPATRILLTCAGSAEGSLPLVNTEDNLPTLDNFSSSAGLKSRNLKNSRCTYHKISTLAFDSLQHGIEVMESQW